MFWKIYGRALKVVATKPIKLFAIALLAELLNVLAFIGFGVVYGVYFCINLLLITGVTMVYLHGYRGDKIEAIQLFDSFRGKDTAKRVLVGMAWKELIVFLWGLIPVVGWVFALIRRYEYRLTPYILVTEPDVEPLEAYKVSKARTKGYVWQMILADLLAYAAVYTVGFTLLLLCLIPFIVTRILFGFTLVVFCIVVVLVLPLFLGLVQAAFYEEISNPSIDTQSGKELSFCTNCGAPLAPDTAFCTACGAPVQKPEAAAPVEAAPAPAAVEATPAPEAIEAAPAPEAPAETKPEEPQA
ncbi:MAG: zinc-ribbon domain-containing protein [Lachnospiraceae bacterium]|nr:zinc-ribbon domain-containing protein [Lachnospiraceae bacterium]